MSREDQALLAIAKQAQKIFHERQGMPAPRFQQAVWMPVVYTILAELDDLGGQEREDLIHASMIERAALRPTPPRRLSP